MEDQAQQQGIAISVNSVSKNFKLPHEKTNSIKSLLINFRKRRTYEKQQALKGISFEVQRGEFFGIVGRNGSGKSTLLKLLAGIYTPSKGNISVNGSLTPFIELGVGFNPELTGKENVFLNGALLGFSRKEIQAMYQEIVDFAELEKFMDQKLKNYSSGMQVRLAFSVAIKARGDILLIDEVLAVGDAAFQQKCFDYFELLKQQQRTVVFVSHDMGAVQRFCDRGIVIENGKITRAGLAAEIAEKYQEDNIDAANAQLGFITKDGKQKAEVTVKVAQNNRESRKVVLEFSYATTLKDDVYIGFSIIRDGANIAELNSLNVKSKKKADKLRYELDTSFFNSGLYEVSAALFSRRNKAAIAMSHKRARFNVRGYDENRGGSLALADSWVED